MTSFITYKVKINWIIIFNDFFSKKNVKYTVGNKNNKIKAYFSNYATF